MERQQRSTVRNRRVLAEQVEVLLKLVTDLQDSTLTPEELDAVVDLTARLGDLLGEDVSGSDTEP